MEQKKEISTILKGALAVCLANASAQIINTLLLPIYSQYLEREDFGIFSIVSMVITILALIYNPGMMTATTRMYYLTEDEYRRRLLIGSSYIFFIVVALLMIGIGILASSLQLPALCNDLSVAPLCLFLSISFVFASITALYRDVRNIQLQ